MSLDDRAQFGKCAAGTEGEAAFFHNQRDAFRSLMALASFPTSILYNWRLIVAVHPRGADLARRTVSVEEGGGGVFVLRVGAGVLFTYFSAKWRLFKRKGELGRERMIGRIALPSTGPILSSLLVAGGILLIALAGIYTRALYEAASIWPANAFMLGILIRFPQLRTGLTWISCSAAFVMADMLTGADLVSNLLLNGCNLVSVATGYVFLVNRTPEDGWFTDGNSAMLFLRAVLIASLITGVVGMPISQYLFGHSAREGFLLWVANELVNYIGILPIILTLPDMRRWASKEEVIFPHFNRSQIAPAAMLVLSVAAGLLVGGPGVLAFPVPALLWCALVYRPFGVAILAFLFAMWAQMSVHAGLLSFGDGAGFRDLLISTKVGVALVGLAPLFLVSVTMARNRMMEKLQHLAEYDVLTNLRNRRGFLHYGSVLFNQARETKSLLVVMMLDLDHFKSINDRHGHVAGDVVLSHFALILQNSLRFDAVSGRIGGEEFAVVLPNCRADEGAIVAARIVEAIRSTSVALGSGIDIGITVSIGVRCVGEDEGLEQALSEADIALYQAKQAGRDQFVIA